MNTARLTLAEVSVALPVTGTFDYRVPEALAPVLECGSRVLVPFGRRQVTGYILKLYTSVTGPDTSYELKEIITSLDNAPLFGPGLIKLFSFAADYYHYPLGLVIAEALPAGLKVMSRRVAVLTPSGREILSSGNLSPEEARHLRRLAGPQGLALSGLVKEKSETLKFIRRFEGRGWIQIEVRLKRDRIRAKTERWLILDQSGPWVRLGPREGELIELLEQNGPLPMSDLRGRFPALSALVRRLEKKNQIKIELREVYRDSLGRALSFDQKALAPTDEQALVIEHLNRAVEKGGYSPFLLHGVTGSGKTEVYLRIMDRVLKKGKSALILVPEISLTPAMEGLIKARFGREVAVIHSGLPEGERFDQWMKVRRGQARIILGARSAIFAPADDLGLIIVDEEHDGSYKQEEKLRYQARDLALVRGSQAQALVILGSATPSMESYHFALNGRYRLLTLKNRIGTGRMPEVEVIDLRVGSKRARGAMTPVLLKSIKETLDREQQVLLFINRRGLAPLPMCFSCGHVIKCLNCSVSLTLHQAVLRDQPERLVCHYCGFEQPAPKRCPACNSTAFRFVGIGTERLEGEVQKRFPEARIGRLDSDITRTKGNLNRILKSLKNGELDALIGTQMITKGHDFPNITLVGVIEADLGLHMPDFRAGERTFQMLAQVAGRAGRGEYPGRVIIQTLNPEHYSLLRARDHDFPGFFNQELSQRRKLGYPPFSRLALARLTGNSEDRTRELAHDMGKLAQDLITRQPEDGLDVIGPAPSPLSKVKGKYRYQILFRARQVKPLQTFLKSWLDESRAHLRGKGVSLALDVDPYQVM